MMQNVRLAYLENGVLPEDSVLARKITLEHPHFEVSDGCLYHENPHRPRKWCPSDHISCMVDGHILCSEESVRLVEAILMADLVKSHASGMRLVYLHAVSRSLASQSFAISRILDCTAYQTVKAC